MNKDVLAQYLKECVLEVKQIFAHVGNPPNKLITKDKIEPLSFQKVRHENGQLGVTWLKHLVVPFGMGKCQFQHVLFHLKEYGDHLVEK
jgi:hypothetical protein